MNVKVLASLLVIGIVGAMLGAGTFAAFSDTETSSDNTFTAGTLDLELDATLPIVIDGVDVYPGVSDGNAGTYALNNTGTVDATSGTITLINVANLENIVTDPELDLGDTGPAGELGDVLTITITVDGQPVITDELVTEDLTRSFDGIGAGLSENMVVTFSVDGAATSIIQTDITEFDIVVTLDQ